MTATNFDTYNLTELSRALTMTAFAGQVHYFAEIGSTNTHAMQQGEAGAPHGSVYLADAQASGRGRGAHQWASPAGSGLYVSVLLRPALAPGDALWFSLAAGMAALTAIRETTGLEADLRWPNDLLFGARKVGGILTEMHAEATRVRHLVIGIGINVHHREFPGELEAVATSLAIEGARTHRAALLTSLLVALDAETVALSGPGHEEAQQSLVLRLEAASTWMRGKRVTITDEHAANPLTGVTAGLNARGFLQVRAADGLRTVLSGGVREAQCC